MVGVLAVLSPPLDIPDDVCACQPSSSFCFELWPSVPSTLELVVVTQ
jgi:hypothetical protein